MHSQYHEYRQSIETVYRDHCAGISRWLHSCFPRVCMGLVDDAVSEAFTDALDTERDRLFVRVWQTQPLPSLLALIKGVAWRHLRGRLRKKASRWVALPDDALESGDRYSPESLYIHRETLLRATELIDEAATRLGGSRARALHAALYTRLGGGSDTDAARAHGIPREYVNRAKRWIAARLRSR